MNEYRPQDIEQKWQKWWEEQGIYKAEDGIQKTEGGFQKKRKTDSVNSVTSAIRSPSSVICRPKYYILFEFPYPSGDRLHVGHGRSYTALDALARKKRMQGYNVLLPMGWDAFGLPAENYAIKMHTTPQKVVPQNIANAKKQAQSWGLSVDWSREINTTDPAYYHWTQWIFLKMYDRGLAYSAELPVNWCPKCKIGLANEEVVNGRCERCGTETERRNVRQWVLKITDYADRLIDDLKLVDYLPKIKAQQINWIGRSAGTTIKFPLLDPVIPAKAGTYAIEVFTTRADTIYGVTALVVSPEHPIISLIPPIAPIKTYVENARRKSELERTDLSKEKTGVFTGLYALNPITGEKIPVWVGDYVIGTYGGGAVMVVPAHDARDFEFAKKYELPIKQVVIPAPQPESSPSYPSYSSYSPYTEYGVLVDSGPYTGLSSEEAIKKITADLVKLGAGGPAKHFHLRDWIFSRQHYWGEPIPLIHCDICGVVPVPESDLPVVLPEIEHYEPTGNTESPLAAVTDWVNVTCPKCGGKAKRDTDTMPNWAGSNWYYVAYAIARKLQKSEVGDQRSEIGGSEKINSDLRPPTSDLKTSESNIFSQNRELLKYWLPVDLYNGGMEHTTLHLLYSRFVYKFLYDLGLVPTPEPYARRRSHGMVLSFDGEKMSKSRGNVINPDDIVKEFGADTFRMYEMFMGPFSEAISWNPQGVVGVNKFLHRVWRLVSQNSVETHCNASLQGLKLVNVEVLLNNLIKKVSEDLSEDSLKFNTAVAAFMSFLNEVEKTGLNQSQKETLLKLLSPFAPHLTEELWHNLGHFNSVHLEPWPQHDPRVVSTGLVTIVIQVNGKVRGQVELDQAESQNESAVNTAARSLPKVQEYLRDKEIKRVIFVPGKLVNYVFRS